MRLDRLSVQDYRNIAKAELSPAPELTVLVGQNGQTNLGRVQDEFDAKIDGNTVEIGFNNRYLLDALRNSKAERVTFQMNGALSPIKILPEEGDDFTYLVLPVRFKND